MTTMSTENTEEVPRFYDFFGPVLETLRTGEVMASREIVRAVADRMNLSKEQREQTVPSGQRRLDNRVHWSLSYLFQAAVVTKPGRGQFQITERGRDLLRDYPGGFTPDVLRQFPEFREFQERTRGRIQNASSSDESVEGQTPLEQIAAATEQIDEEVASELIQRLHLAPPEFLEKAVLRLLVAMGYGGSDRAAVHLGGPGDGGFDGVINQDSLGIGRVYIQAKRYAPDNIVGRPAVQAFVGALHHAGAAGGVIITTSRFSPDAVSFAQSITPRVILIDGAKLGQLMVDHGIGVQERQVFRVVDLDEDFFEET